MEPRVFTKGTYIRLIFSKEKREATLYKSEKKIFLSIVVKKKILVLVALVVIKAPTRQVQIEPES